MRILRLAFLAPAIADFLVAFLTLTRMAGIADDSLLPRGQFAGVAACWGVLLLLGLRKPVERAWILGPTAVVIGCIGAAFLFAFAAGVVPAASMVLGVALSVVMIWLCWAGLAYANREGGT